MNNFSLLYNIILNISNKAAHLFSLDCIFFTGVTYFFGSSVKKG